MCVALETPSVATVGDVSLVEIDQPNEARGYTSFSPRMLRSTQSVHIANAVVLLVLERASISLA